MPLFYKHIVNPTTKLGIWHITEDEDFFKKKVFIRDNITHPHKRLQHLAGRYLLPTLFGDFPFGEILIADTKKPYLPEEQYHFSISHCGNFAAAIVSSSLRVGVDIEKITGKVQRIAHKFVHEDEWKYLLNDATKKLSPASHRYCAEKRLLTMLWSAKESLFKWYGLGKVDFRENMQLRQFIKKEGDGLILPFVFKKGEIQEVVIHSKNFNDLVLSWIA